MNFPARHRIILALLLLLAAGVFVAGIDWGLPSRAVDPFLFGDRPPWTGEQVLELAPEWHDPTLGADVDVTPLTQRDQPILLNQTDADRAEILRRYRLYSYQPDEMITFRALAGMNPRAGQLDPRLYQYGGLWIYPVGAMLQIASALNLVTLRGDIAWYLDHPEQFARFYIVARVYTVLWGMVGVWAVFWIVRRAASLIAATGAAAGYICLPVVVNMSHEAKPHLPGTVLMLLAIIAAIKFIEHGRTRWWIIASILCGAAAGMVLSAAVIFIILPIMILLRDDPWKRRIIITVSSILIAAGVYFITNPYVAINTFINRPVLQSNFANTAAMYEFGRLVEGFFNAMKLMREGTSLGAFIFALLGLLVLLIRAVRTRHVHPLAWLLGTPALVITLQFIALAAGKPGEYGRFALLPDIALTIAAACAIAMISPRILDRVIMIALLIALAAFPSWFYLRGFIADASDRPRRLDDAYWLSLLQQAGATTLGIYLEPAPYSLPPVDLFHWNIILLPRDFDITRDRTNADVIIRPVDVLGPNGAVAGGFVRHSVVGPADAFPTRISWADKPFEVWVRPDLIQRLR